MASLSLAHAAPCLPTAGDAGDAAWLVVARSLDDAGRDGRTPSDAEVRVALDGITRTLRQRGAGPERVLVLVKCVAHAVLDACGTPIPPHERAERLSRLVGWTIDAYYADA